jgi:hypothetical protein
MMGDGELWFDSEGFATVNAIGAALNSDSIR